MQKAQTTRAIIAYEDHRSPTSQHPPVILVHGAGDHHGDWALELREGLQAIAVDLPGHGESPPPGRASIADYVADISALLDTIHIEKACFIGHSMGGAICQMLALNHPQQVAGLVIIGSGAALPVNPAIIAGMRDNPQETARQVARWSWAKHIDEPIKEAYYQHLLQTPPHITMNDYIACDRFNVRDQLSRITAPTLILAGSVDRMTPPALSEELAAALPQAQLIIIENGGHRFAAEQPALVSQHIQNWLSTQIVNFG